ncbi:MAG: monofunctional biosynthetic peptidoglycan transglycosylase [bacterium]|nr:monofunctional biosynthetic peptidoglycan transglycosylase [bacterium]
MAETKPQKKKMSRKRKIFLFILLGIFLAVSLFIAYFFLSLPDVSYLKQKNPKTTAMMEQRKQQAQKKGKTYRIRHKWVSFRAIPRLLKQTVLIAEDAAFYQHEGIDYYELKEAIKRNLRDGKKSRGGSTITQQLAKNLFLSTEKSYYRKIKELFIAKKLERHLTKDRIFSIYLNVIEFGPGIFGVEAAARHYFGKPVGQINLEQIIRLVSVIPKPLKVTPLSNSKYLKWRANLLLDRLKKYGHVSSYQYHREKARFRN